MACYRNGGCGPYEYSSCSECPASKPTYLGAFQTCKNCGEMILAVFVLRHTTSDKPIEYSIKPRYCPVCGVKLSDDK